MVKKKTPGFIGTVEWDDTPRPPRTRPSLFPSREQVVALPPFQPPPQRHTMKQQSGPVLAAVVQEVDSNAVAADSNDVEMEDAFPSLEYASVDMDTEHKSSCSFGGYEYHTKAITASLSRATQAAPHSSSFRTPTAPRPEAYKTPPHGPSCSPITPPAQLATENSDADQHVSSLELPAPVAAVHPPESTSALRSTLFSAPTVPRPEGYDTLQQAPSFSPLTPSAQPPTEDSNAGRSSSVDEPAVSAIKDEPTAVHGTSDYHATESDNEDYTASEREVWDAAPTSPAQKLKPISRAARRAQGRSAFPLLRLPPKAIHRILDFLLVYDEPIALVRKSSNRRIVEAAKSHILTVGKGKITREPQGKKFKLKSNVTRNINTASSTNLFLVCRGLRDLGVKTYYNKNTFAFSDEQNLIGWAASIGSRRNEVRKVDLRSEWEVLFKHNDIHSKYLGMTAGKGGILYTPEPRVFTYIEQIHVDIALRMPWQRTGKLPDYDKVSVDAQKMCVKFGKWMAKGMNANFRRLELNNTPLIAKHLHVWFDRAWEEPWYESAEFKRRHAEDKLKLAAERAAQAASSGKGS
ncbi:hypothetical protein Q7P35_006686 [Cladosporium inversicolor]